MSEIEKTPKEKKELAVFDVKKFSITQLPELKGKKEEIASIIAANPIVEIIDNETYEQAKKSRTAVRSLRTATEKEQSEVKRNVKTLILDVIDSEYTTIVSAIKTEENLRQEAVTVWEAKKEAEKAEKARLEQERINNINKLMNDYVSEWKTAFNLMVFDTIEETGKGFIESYTNFDLNTLEEFQSLFPEKILELTQYLSEKTNVLTEAENARLEKERLAAEAERIAKEQAELAEQKRLTEEAEAKAKSEREQFEKEKREFEEAKAKAAKKERFEKRKQILLDLGFTYDVNREYNFSLEGVWSCFHEQIDDCSDEWFTEYLLDIKEAIAAKKAKNESISEKAETPEILQPELPTANICTSLNDAKETTIETPQAIAENPLTPAESFKPTTWNDIIKEFTNSGATSYSKWLIENYNVPTKIIS